MQGLLLAAAIAIMSVAIHDNIDFCGDGPRTPNSPVAIASATNLVATGDYDGNLLICGIQEDDPAVATALWLRSGGVDAERAAEYIVFNAR